MVALSRCTTETVQPYGDCSMRGSPSQPISVLWKDSLEAGGRRESPYGRAEERGMCSRQAVQPRCEAASTRSGPLGP